MKNMNNKIRGHAIRQAGFTLFELLVSISIIGILVAVASVSYSGAQKKARDARRKEDVNMIHKAAEQYYSQANYQYPINTSAPGSWTPSGGAATLEVFPVDPKNGVAGFGYTYTPNIPVAGGYCVCALLDEATGNSTNSLCNSFVNDSTGSYYCAKNVQ